jgi:hypothetical protein
MSEVIEETKEPEAGKGHSKVARAATQAAGVGMALMGSSLAGNALGGGGIPDHTDHGYAPARWAAAAVSILGWLIGGIAFPFGVWPLVVVGGALQIVAVIVNLAMNAAGMGAKANDQWALAKADAKAARAAAKAA